MRLMKTLVLLLIGATVTVALSGASFAAVVAPGVGPVAPDLFASAPTGTLLASSTSPYSTPGGDGGTLVTAVVQEASGNLDFLYQWTANAGNPDNYIATSAINYGTFTTDVGYIAAGAALSTDLTTAGFVSPVGLVATPNSVQRSVSGNTVDWFFTGTAFPPGSTSVILMVQTDATSYTAGVAGIQDGTTANAPAFAPAAIPEPISLLVWAGIGAVGIAVRSLRKR